MLINNRTFFYFIFLLFCSFLVSCGDKKTQQAPPPVPKARTEKVEKPKKVVPPKYEFKGSMFRDFLQSALSKAGPSTDKKRIEPKEDLSRPETIVFNFDSVRLRGFLSSGLDKFALISDDMGNSFVLRDGKLYDIRQKIIPGASGLIKKRSVVLTYKSQIKELSMKRFKDEK